MSAMRPAIAVAAYNRPRALERLLRSLARGVYPGGEPVRLIVSIDRGPEGVHPAVRAAAERFAWPHGPLEVVCQPRRLGLVDHIFWCWGLSADFGSVIFLEDDLLASPVLYPYAAQALAAYRDDARIAGLNLSSLWFNGYTQQPFVPLADAGDTFFVGVPFNQGQAFTAGQWRAFDAWRRADSAPPRRDPRVHESFYHFDAEDWFPWLARYGAETERWTVYPRVSLATATGEAGVHFARPSRFLQSPLQRGKTAYRLLGLDESTAVYDSFFEILPERLNRLAPALRGYDYAVDLYAARTRAQLTADYALTSRPCRQAALSFGRSLWPLEANVIEAVPGEEICLCRTGDVRWDGWSALRARRGLHEYFTRGRRMSRRLRLLLWLAGWLERAGGGH